MKKIFLVLIAIITLLPMAVYSDVDEIAALPSGPSNTGIYFNYNRVKAAGHIDYMNQNLAYLAYKYHARHIYILHGQVTVGEFIFVNEKHYRDVTSLLIKLNSLNINNNLDSNYFSSWNLKPESGSSNPTGRHSKDEGR